jgi:hypothetical protein
VEFESPHPAAASPSASCPRDGGHQGRASPSMSWKRSPLDAEHRRSRRPCHPRAISSGHQQYLAVNHGQSARFDQLGARSWPAEGCRPETAWHGTAGSPELAKDVQQRLGDDEAGQREQLQEQPQLAPDDRTHTPPQGDRSGARRRGGALVGILRHGENLHRHGGWSLVQSGRIRPLSSTRREEPGWEDDLLRRSHPLAPGR